jgi:hypothetical protein
VIALAVIAAAATVQVGDGLDCAQGFDALAAQFKAVTTAKPYASDPLLDTSSDNDLYLYMTTKPGHPAHPMAVKRFVQAGSPTTVVTSACGYGDKAAGDALMQQVYKLNVRLAQSY